MPEYQHIIINFRTQVTINSGIIDKIFAKIKSKEYI